MSQFTKIYLENLRILVATRLKKRRYVICLYPHEKGKPFMILLECSLESYKMH